MSAKRKGWGCLVYIALLVCLPALAEELWLSDAKACPGDLAAVNHQ